ncbi:zinc finger, CCHC-type containing protein [Tanacetum coccineum]
MKTKRKLVPKCIAIGNGAYSVEGNILGWGLYDNVCSVVPSVSPKRQCVRQSNSVPCRGLRLQMSGVPAVVFVSSTCRQSLSQSTSTAGVNRHSISISGHCDDAVHVAHTDTSSCRQSGSGTRQPVVPIPDTRITRHAEEQYSVLPWHLAVFLDGFIVASIEQYSDLDEMSVDEAIGRLKTFEERIKSKKKIPVDSQESLMFTRHEGQRKPFRERGRFNQSRGREQDKNNYKREERASFEEDTRDKTPVTCYRCHKLGHYAYECPNKRKNQVREHSNFIEEDLAPTLLMATINEKK